MTRQEAIGHVEMVKEWLKNTNEDGYTNMIKALEIAIEDIESMDLLSKVTFKLSDEVE